MGRAVGFPDRDCETGRALRFGGVGRGFPVVGWRGVVV